MFPDSRHDEQLILHSHQHIVVTVEDSVLRTESGEDVPRKRMSPNVFSSVIR
jgi:hypothetical protein